VKQNFHGTLWVFTFKEGLLSRVAHDLRFVLTDCVLEQSEKNLNARFPLAGMALEGALKKGKLDPACLSSKDHRKILNTLHRDILKISQHPVAALSGQRIENRFEGTLTLCGREQPISCALRPQQHGFEGRLEICPSHWGIAPFKALFGTIQLQDRVGISFVFEAVENEPNAA
jgi:hypothetical protein